MAAPPSPKCSVTCNSTCFSNLSVLQSQTLARSLTGRRCGWLWRLCWLRRVETDGNKEEEGCLLPGSFHPKPSLSPRPTPPPGSRLTRFPCLLKRQKGQAAELSKLQVATTEVQGPWTTWKVLLRRRQTNIHRLVISVTATAGTSCDGSHTPSEMIGGLTKMLCMARLFSIRNRLLFRQNKGLTALRQTERDSQECNCISDQQCVPACNANVYYVNYTMYMRLFTW